MISTTSSESRRIHRPAQWLHHLCGAVIALGSIGHSLASGPQIRAMLAAAALPSAAVDLVTVVWHFAGGCMALMGLAVIVDGWRRRGTWVSLGVALFYAGFGVVAWAWSGQHFFAVFIVLGAGLLVARAWAAWHARIPRPRSQTG